ncbi:Arginase/deacetylase [Trametopsis cervina]|nr:Arginase/deacetylase [Trametopsis cervina]
MVRIYLQDACLRHKFIRDRDASNVFERPERLRAVNIGIAAAYARLEAAALNISMASGRTNAKISPPFVFVRSAKSIRILEHDAARYIHGGAGTEDSPTMHSYGASLEAWCLDSAETIAKGQSEIPPNFEQDLYLSPESMSAFEGALGTVCEAVDDVMTSRPIYSAPNRGTQLDGRAFVVVRPPGHHCSEDTPMGFGFVNNVAVGAVHASKEHGIRRVVIFDYDLHHGNGTQTIVRNINERLNANGVRASALDPLIFYGSIHDILSYPCEDGDPDLVDDASLSLSGVNGNWIENIHLQAYASEAQFWEYYHRLYSRLFSSATRFIENTGGAALDDVLVFISSGFDASEYETEDMSRHERKVPTAFYHRFTRDACKFAGKYAAGRIISVLEGGYSDRALTSGALAHVTALADVDGITDQDWWDSKRLAQLEKATKRRRGRPARSDKLGSWLRRTVEIFKVLDTPTGENTSEVIRVPDLADDVKQAMQEEMRQTSLKRKQTNPGPQTRAKRSKTAIDPKRVHLGAPTDERESSDDDDAR